MLFSPFDLGASRTTGSMVARAAFENQTALALKMAREATPDNAGLTARGNESGLSRLFQRGVCSEYFRTVLVEEYGAALARLGLAAAQRQALVRKLERELEALQAQRSESRAEAGHTATFQKMMELSRTSGVVLVSEILLTPASMTDNETKPHRALARRFDLRNPGRFQQLYTFCFASEAHAFELYRSLVWDTVLEFQEEFDSFDEEQKWKQLGEIADNIEKLEKQGRLTVKLVRAEACLLPSAVFDYDQPDAARGFAWSYSEEGKVLAHETHPVYMRRWLDFCTAVHSEYEWLVKKASLFAPYRDSILEGRVAL